jgi:hypothetical protein
VTGLEGVRGHAIVLASVALLAGISASRSGTGALFAPAATADRTVVIGSASAPVVTTSDRPVIAGSWKRAEGQREPLLAAMGEIGVVASHPLAWDVRLPGSVAAADPAQLGHAQRGPPAPRLP